jgi:hypothetical protein
LGIGANASTTRGITVNVGLTGTQQFCVSAGSTFTSAATTGGTGFSAGLGTQAAAFTCTDLTNYLSSNAAKGAGSTITRMIGFRCDDLSSGTTNRAVWLRVAAGANNHNVYADGTAQNYFAGNVGIGVTAPLSKLHISGASGWIIQDEQDTDPTATELDADDSIAIYNKNDKFVIAYNNGGTITYITIPLDGSTTTWTHSTSAP